MLEEKIKIGLFGIALALSTGACGNGKSCANPNYRALQAVENNLKTTSGYTLGTLEYNEALSASCASGDCCRSGCSYDTKSGCCWCPD